MNNSALTGQATEIAGKIDKSFDYSRDGEPGIATGVWDEEIAAFADSSTLKSLFFSEDWVYIIVDICAQKISSTPLRIARTKKNPGGITTEFVFDHPLNKIIQNPNPWQRYPDWMYLCVVEEILGGNAINWYAAQTQQLMLLPFDRVNLDFDNKGFLETYILTTSDVDQTRFGTSTEENRIRFPANEIIHVQRPNPSSLLWGLSPFIPGRKALLFNRYSSDYLNAFYLKQATPGMAITMDRTVNEELAIRQLASFEMAYTGRKNMRRTLMLPKGTDVKPLTHSLADQRLVETIQTNRETIINLLKVPKHELNLNGSASLGSQEFRVALRNFWEATLIPTQKRIAAAMTEFFQRQSLLKNNEVFMFDNGEVDALKDDLMKKAEIAKEMAQTMPLNQVNARIWQIDPIDDPRADLPLSLAPSGNVTALIDDGSVGTAAPGETPVNPAGNEANQVDDDDEEEDKSFASEYMSKNELWITEKQNRFKGVLEEQGEKIEDMTLELFLDFAESVVKIVKQELVEKARIPRRQRLRRKIRDAFEDREEEYVEAYFETLKDVTEQGFLDQITGPVFSDQDRDALRAIRVRDLENRRGILRARGLETFSGMSTTQTERVMKQIEVGIKRGETVGDIAARITRQFADPESMIRQARTIARTETLTAVSVGENAAFDAAHSRDKKLQKMWLNLGDERVRGRPDGVWPKTKDDHWVLQGQRRGKDKSFTNGLQYPRDLLSDNPAKVINCRCTLAIVRKGS